MPRPLILISNDDGIHASGIKKLVELMSQIGEVIVVAPDSPQSGMGHAITVRTVPLRLSKIDIFGNILAYQCSGTPADCIKLAKREVLKNRKINLLVSGINHGANTSISVLYSGTMSAAIEGAIDGIPSIGFSLCDESHSINFSHVDEYILKITNETLVHGIPNGIALNVNIPAKQNQKIKGIKITKQATTVRWEEDFNKRKDPYGRDYYWLSGKFVDAGKEEDHDAWAIANNYVSIVPCQFDLTGHHAIGDLSEKWNL